LPEIPEKSAGTLLLRAYHGTVLKVSTPDRAEQTDWSWRKNSIREACLPGHPGPSCARRPWRSL